MAISKRLLLILIIVAICCCCTVISRTVPEGRIYGGQNAREGQFPYQVMVTRSRNGYLTVCGGAIISRNYVLTAAHCIDRDSAATEYLVRAGTVKFNAGGVGRQVAEVKIHPQYQSFDYDVALLRLSRPLDFNDKIKSIPLAKKDVPVNTPTIVSGWGGISSGGLANTLQYNTLYTLSHKVCVQRLNTIANSMRCLGKSAGNGICGGDSGGPAVAKGTLIGISSFIVNGCASSLPNGFSDVVYTRDWIRKNSDAP